MGGEDRPDPHHRLPAAVHPRGPVHPPRRRRGELGDIVYVRAQALRRRGIPPWGVFGRKELQGGGPLIDIGVHILEVSHYLIGKPTPVAASAATYTYLGDRKPEATSPWGDWDYKTYTVEDLACGFVRFEGGTTLCIESSFAAHIEKNIFSTTLMGTKAGARWGGGGGIFTDYVGKMVNIEPQVFEKEQGFARKMQNWIDTVRGGHNEAPGEDGLVVQKILDALYKSSEKGKEVAIR
ncbi:MAG: Gfo/Idh/MocA family protein [Planctomycetota bacterium]